MSKQQILCVRAVDKKRINTLSKNKLIKKKNSILFRDVYINITTIVAFYSQNVGQYSTDLTMLNFVFDLNQFHDLFFF